MNNLNKQLDKAIEETEEVISQVKKRFEEETGEEFKRLELLDPTNGLARQRQLYRFHNPRLSSLKSVKQKLEKFETKPLEEKIEKTEDLYAESWDKDIEELMNNYGNLRTCLKQCIKLLNGEKYELILGSADRAHPNKESLENIEERIQNDLFQKLREKHVHALIAASALLNKMEESTTYIDLEEEDHQKIEEINQSIENVKYELRKRSKDLDTMLLKASEKSEKGKEIQQRYSNRLDNRIK